jgi:prepilin-type processing-associated H-X9-DG protein
MYRNDWHNYLPPEDALNSHTPPTPGDWYFTKDYMMWSSIGPYLGPPSGPTKHIDGKKYYDWGFIEWNPNHQVPTGTVVPGPDFSVGFSLGAIKRTVWECTDPKTSDRDDWLSMNSYAESRYLYYDSPNANATPSWPRPFGRIPDPASAVHVSDAYYPTDAYTGFTGGGTGTDQVKNLGDAYHVKNPALQGPTGWDLYRHNRGQGAAVLFADGHARYVSRDEVLKSLTDVDGSTANSIWDFRLAP